MEAAMGLIKNKGLVATVTIFSGCIVGGIYGIFSACLVLSVILFGWGIVSALRQKSFRPILPGAMAIIAVTGSLLLFKSGTLQDAAQKIFLERIGNRLVE
jgi:hypothetical protein